MSNILLAMIKTEGKMATQMDEHKNDTLDSGQAANHRNILKVSMSWLHSSYAYNYVHISYTEVLLISYGTGLTSVQPTISVSTRFVLKV